MTETFSSDIPSHVDAAARELLRRARNANVLLATAESCTGGLLASLLTDVEGASCTFDRGFVVYSAESKCELLGIERDSLDQCGAVSPVIARAMAWGALKGSRADVALAITGYAGALGAEGEPGLVYLSCARRDGAVFEREEHFGDVGRGPVRIATIAVALQLMLRAIG